MTKRFKFNSLNSTSLKAYELLKNKEKTPFYITSLTQLKGRGSHNKKWESPNGGLYLQAVYSYKGLPKTHLPQRIAVILAKFLKNHFSITVTVKWPNDLIFCGKKIAGILCERHTVSDHSFLSLGIGINILKAPSGESFPYKTVCLQEIFPGALDLNKIGDLLIETLDKNFSSMTAELPEEDFSRFFMPKETLWHHKKNYKESFIYKSMSPEGFMLLEEASKKLITIKSAENPYAWYYLDNNIYPKPVLILETTKEALRFSFFFDFRDKKIKKQFTLTKEDKKKKEEKLALYIKEISSISPLQIMPLITEKETDKEIPLIKKLLTNRALSFSLRRTESSHLFRRLK